MKCSACGMQLPAGVAYCHNCGTPTPAFYAPTGTSSNNPTVSSSPENVPPPPYTNYGSQQYGAESPYSTLPPNPYNTPLPASYIPNKEAQFVPPPPPSQRRGNHIGLIIGIVVLLLVVIVGGVLTVSHLGTQGGTTSATPTATVAPAEKTWLETASMSSRGHVWLPFGCIWVVDSSFFKVSVSSQKNSRGTMAT